MRLSTKRLVELHCLADDFQSRSRVCARAANALRDIGNKRGAHYMTCKGLRYQAIAEKAVRRIEAGK